MQAPNQNQRQRDELEGGVAGPDLTMGPGLGTGTGGIVPIEQHTPGPLHLPYDDSPTWLQDGPIPIVGEDGIVVASPHTLHYEHAHAALERGLHVMCEKPMTTNAAEARQLVQLAEDKGVHLLVPYGWHYKEFVQQAKRLMDDGAVGDIEYVLCHMASPIVMISK